MNLFACNSSNSNPNPDTSSDLPILLNTIPDHAPAGSFIRLQGSGFSSIPNENIILLEGSTTVGLTFELIEEAERGIEEITFQLPEDLGSGNKSLMVLVGDGVSNPIDFEVD